MGVKTEEEKKEAKRLKSKRYYEKNKEKIKERRKEYDPILNKKYREENREVLKERRKKNYDKDGGLGDRLKRAEYRKEYGKKYREENPEYFKKKNKEYNKNNRDKINEYTRVYAKNRKLVDPQYKLSGNIRQLIHQAFRRNNYTKKSKTHSILGCSFDELKNHMENQFTEWMTWDNHGSYNGELNHGWDIDHIVPLSSAETEEDIIKLNHYTNLQPLCGYTNRNIKKGNVDIIYFFL